MSGHEPRQDVVNRLADIIGRMVVDGDEEARREWEGRAEWATTYEVSCAAAVAFDGVEQTLAAIDDARQADTASGLDDWAFAASHGIDLDS